MGCYNRGLLGRSVMLVTMRLCQVWDVVVFLVNLCLLWLDLWFWFGIREEEEAAAAAAIVDVTEAANATKAAVVPRALCVCVGGGVWDERGAKIWESKNHVYWDEGENNNNNNNNNNGYLDKMKCILDNLMWVFCKNCCTK